MHAASVAVGPAVKVGHNLEPLLQLMHQLHSASDAWDGTAAALKYFQPMQVGALVD